VKLVEIEDLHPGLDGPTPIYADGLLRIDRTARPPGLRLTGDVDASNVEAVTVALSVAVRRGDDLHVDLSGLQFCDVGGLRAIVSAAERLGGGRRLVLRGLPYQLRRVMHLIGWDESAGLVLADRVAEHRPSRTFDQLGEVGA